MHQSLSSGRFQFPSELHGQQDAEEPVSRTRSYCGLLHAGHAHLQQEAREKGFRACSATLDSGGQGWCQLCPCLGLLSLSWLQYLDCEGHAYRPSPQDKMVAMIALLAKHICLILKPHQVQNLLHQQHLSCPWMCPWANVSKQVHTYTVIWYTHH